MNSLITLPNTKVNSKEIYSSKYPLRMEGKNRKVRQKKSIVKLGLKGGCLEVNLYLLMEKPHLLEINTVPGITTKSIIPQQVAAMGMDLFPIF